MARESQDYRDILEHLRQLYPDRGTLTVQEVAAYCNRDERTVCRKYIGWDQQGRGKQISIPNFARQLCGR